MADTEVKQEAAWLKWTGIIVSVIQIILAVSFVGMVFWINIFPVKIEVIIIVVLILLSALALYLQFLKYGWVSGKRGNELCQQQRADRSYFRLCIKR